MFSHPNFNFDWLRKSFNISNPIPAMPSFRRFGRILERDDSSDTDESDHENTARYNNCIITRHPDSDIEELSNSETERQIAPHTYDTADIEIIRRFLEEKSKELFVAMFECVKNLDRFFYDGDLTLPAVLEQLSKVHTLMLTKSDFYGYEFDQEAWDRVTNPNRRPCTIIRKKLPQIASSPSFKHKVAAASTRGENVSPAARQSVKSHSGAKKRKVDEMESPTRRSTRVSKKPKSRYEIMNMTIGPVVSEEMAEKTKKVREKKNRTFAGTTTRGSTPQGRRKLKRTLYSPSAWFKDFEL